MVRRSVKVLLLLLSGCIAAATLGEVTLRVVYGDKFGKRPVFYGASDGLGWAPTPDLNHTFYGEDFSTHIRTDNNGYRLGALGEVDFSRRLIVLCGDSFVFGWGVSTDETFASFLDEMVSRHTEGRMRVVNLAAGGYGTWQYHNRLRDFTQAYPEADIAAVVVFHCQNDAVDNIVTAGYTLADWKSESRRPPDKSRWHLVNYLRYSRERISAARESGQDAPAADPESEDVLWGYRGGRRTELNGVIDVGGTPVQIGRRSPADTSPQQLVKRKSMTPLQSQLYRLAVESIHGVANGAGSGVIHTYVYTTGDWYVALVDELIKNTPGEGVTNLGRVPAAGSYDGDFINKHKGRHYTPDFNRFWAEVMFEQLQAHGVIDTAAPGNPKR
jgi:hypothetical protein